jgi:hypothetical protein
MYSDQARLGSLFGQNVYSLGCYFVVGRILRGCDLPIQGLVNCDHGKPNLDGCKQSQLFFEASMLTLPRQETITRAGVGMFRLVAGQMV